MTCGIYLLRDPTSGIVRYVGKSKNIEQRVKQHLASRSSTQRLSRWIEELWLQGLRPAVSLIKADGDCLDKVETFYIRSHWGTSFNGIVDGVFRQYRDDVIYPPVKVTPRSVFYGIRDWYCLRLRDRAVRFGFSKWWLHQGSQVRDRGCKYALRFLQSHKETAHVFSRCWLEDGYALQCEDERILERKDMNRLTDHWRNRLAVT